MFSQWQWPTPILLEDLRYESIGYSIWDPRANPAERNQVMPIITPAYPAFNSSYSVTENTLRIIVQEFIEAERICSQMFKRTNPNASIEDFLEGWRFLTQPFPFFETYPNFLKVRHHTFDVVKCDVGCVFCQLQVGIDGVDRMGAVADSSTGIQPLPCSRGPTVAN